MSKKKNSSNDVSLAASAILFRKLCRLFHSIFGRDGRGSKSGRRPIEHTGIVIPIPAALPLAQTNRLHVKDAKLNMAQIMEYICYRVTQIMENICDRVEKHCGKKEKMLVTSIISQCFLLCPKQIYF